MNRTGILRTASFSKSKAKCKYCKVNPVFRPGAKVCSPECAIKFNDQLIEKAARIAAKKQAAADRTALLQFKPLSYWEKIAERHCNAYIRARDPDECISCGVTKSSAWQAGHYISVGANKTLRYNEQNIHKQCVQCNVFEGSNAIQYRIGLVHKIGFAEVEKLEGWHAPIKLTAEYLQEVAEHYRKKLKELSAVKQNATQV